MLGDECQKALADRRGEPQLPVLVELKNVQPGESPALLRNEDFSMIELAQASRQCGFAGSPRVGRDGQQARANLRVRLGSNAP